MRQRVGWKPATGATRSEAARGGIMRRFKEKTMDTHQKRPVRGALTAAVLVLLGAGAQPVAGGTLPLYGGLARCTPTVVVPAGGAVYCVAVAETPPTEPINVLIARILAGPNKLVEQFGYGFAAAPGVVSVGWYAEEATTSFSPRSRYCQVVLDPADAALTVDFTVHANGQVILEFHEGDLGPCPSNNGRN